MIPKKINTKFNEQDAAQVIRVVENRPDLQGLKLGKAIKILWHEKIKEELQKKLSTSTIARKANYKHFGDEKSSN